VELLTHAKDAILAILAQAGDSELLTRKRIAEFVSEFTALHALVTSQRNGATATK
jgi:hypothetical protein